ncbi:MAG: hypothetical protein ACRCXY_03640 [Fusobacteriaceae bacterium]
MKYFYLNSEHLKKGYPAVLLIKDTPLENYEIEFLNTGISAREYVGEYLPERLIYDEKSRKVREATEQEKYHLDPINYILREDLYYLKNEEVKLKPKQPQDMLKPIFEIEREEWKESATELEIKNYYDEKYKMFYHFELENFTKVTSEYNAGVKTQEEYVECQEYIRALASQLNSDIRVEIERPNSMI